MLRDLLPITPCTIWHCNDVSDLHIVLSHADIPSIIPGVIMFDPTLDPCTVTLVDPVTAALDRKIELTIPTPPEKPVDVLPDRIPTEITRYRLLKMGPCSLQLIPVSDTHLDCSQPLCPALADMEEDRDPIALPITLTLTDPLLTLLVFRSPLIRPETIDTPMLMLPPHNPTLATLRRLPARPWLVRQRADVSDSQPVRSQPVTPVWALTLTAPPVPSPAPCTVTLTDPVAGAPLPTLAVLSQLLCTDQADVSLPTRPPLVKTACLLEAAPLPAWHRTDVSEPQVDRSHAVLPAPACPVISKRPRFLPARVMLFDPVVTTLDACTLLDPPTSDDTANDRLPCRLPTDNNTRPLLLAPCAIRHLTDESDSHAVTSQAVVTSRPPAELPE